MKKKLMVCALGFGISLNCMGQEFSSELTSTVDRDSASLGYKMVMVFHISIEEGIASFQLSFRLLNGI